MSLKSDIENKSIREALAAIADKVDSIAPQDVSALTNAITELKAAVQSLKVEIDGEPAAPTPGVPELPQPSTPG